MFENLILLGAVALFAIVLLVGGLVVLVAIVRAFRRRPSPTSDPGPMGVLSPGPVDPIAAFNTASDGHMQHAIFSDIGKARAEKWKREMGELLTAPKPTAPPPPPNG